jgi:Ca2+-binding EF-hand superfamily protein
MFSAIQLKIKMVCSAQEAFMQMEKGVGFLTIKDIISQMPSLFGISLKRDEFLKLFKEIDSDKDGLVKYKEFEEFYNRDYELSLKNIQRE